GLDIGARRLAHRGATLRRGRELGDGRSPCLRPVARQYAQTLTIGHPARNAIAGRQQRWQAGGKRLDGGVTGLVNHRREQEQIGRGVGARQLLLSERARAGHHWTERGFERITLATDAGAEQMRRNALLQDLLHYWDEQRDIFAGVELAGIHDDQPIRWQAEARLEPGAVAPRRRK